MSTNINEILLNILLKIRLYRRGLNMHMRVFSHTTVQERLELYNLCWLLPRDARALEIGSHIGSSALFICAGLACRNGRLICVDTWMNQTMPDGQKDTLGQFMQNTKCYKNIISPIRKFSHQVTQSDIGGPLDFVFLDGDHSEQGVQKDFHLIAPWVKSGGLIAFHDLRSQFPGVGIVVGQALASGDWELVSFIDSLATIRRI